MKTALIVIDVQNYFVSEDLKDLPSKIAKHIKETPYDFVIFTQFVNSENWYFYKHGWRACLTSPDIDIHADIRASIKGNNIFQKTAYSAFKAKGFEEFLKENNITKLSLCGIDTDACVLASAYEAFDLG